MMDGANALSSETWRANTAPNEIYAKPIFGVIRICRPISRSCIVYALSTDQQSPASTTAYSRVMACVKRSMPNFNELDQRGSTLQNTKTKLRKPEKLSYVSVSMCVWGGGFSRGGVNVETFWSVQNNYLQMIRKECYNIGLCLLFVLVMHI